tara:strand:- start:1664 stop:1834 length:171 start_codon:yes stop_codon:yes gene_type:complete
MVVVRFAPPVNENAVALPLWDHRLTLGVDRNTVTPTLTVDGDDASPNPLVDNYPVE